MEQKISKIIECLSSIKGVDEIEENNGYIVFCYRNAYFLCFLVEGCGKLDQYIHIALSFDLQLNDNQLDLARDICFETMVKYESLRLYINDDGHNSISIYFMADYEDKRLAKAIRQYLNDSIEAYNYFIERFLIMDSRNFNL